MQTELFDPLKTVLRKGVNLIEASAGTGKTYAIAMLVLRFVVEQGIPVDQLLVVTFTKAATEELKDRIRGRLSEAKRVLQGQASQADNAVVAWLNSLEIAPELIRQRLTLALLDIDQAGIFTIHGFCRHILREHALESGQLFDVELTGDLAMIKQACIDDFWRKQIYLDSEGRSRSAWEIGLLTADFKTPDRLLAGLAGFPGSALAMTANVKIFPENQSLDDALTRLRHLADIAAASLEPCTQSLLAGIAEQKFKSSYSADFTLHRQAFSDWLQGNSTEMPGAEAFVLLTAQGLLDGLHGNKFRATKTQSAERRKADYLAQLAIDTAPFDALAAAYKNIAPIFRRFALETLRVDLEQHLQQMNVLSFDLLISRLAEALQSEKKSLLVAQLQQRFAAALIDEFQDTDDQQWLIFSSAFAAPSQYLYLIGDPKQAIYKFRGADIYSYLAAQQRAEHRYTLAKNWRSHPRLVEAVNRLFQKERAFLLDDVVFQNVKPAKSEKDGALSKNGQAIAPMMLWQLPESAGKTGYWTAGKAAEEIKYAVINEVTALLNDDFTLQPIGRSLQPQDIAILVRTNSQAVDYQTLLRTAGITSVINNTDSVFVTQEALDLHVLLQAVANPGDSALLKQVLALDWFGLDGQAFYRTINSEAELDERISRFLGYYQDWLKSGLMAMLLHLLEQENIRTHIADKPAAERRLTNLHQLIELLQQAALEEHLGINKTLDWLKTAIVKAETDENQLMRLESDENAVKIVTMHRSKGLEYPIVFCPCLWQRGNRLHSEKYLLKCHADGRMIVDLGSENFEQHRALALYEELAEDLRVFYVAVTRAQYRCYLAWANARSEHIANDSAMVWLLDFAEADFSGQQSRLQTLQREAGQSFDYQLLKTPNSLLDRGMGMSCGKPALLPAKRKRALHTSWQMSSYTALSALSLSDAPELPEDKAREQPAKPEKTPAELPRGAHTGNVVHDLLENNGFSDLAQQRDISPQREKACLRYGLKLEQPALLDDLLHAIVSTPLSPDDTGFCLKNLPDSQCLKEMPFYLAMQSMDAAQINALLEDTPAYQPLSSKQMSGFLTGFIDLVCCYQGRYYVMDYKTNGLPDYEPETLGHAMREHNYGLQYWLYTVVLHRYLQNRLPGYAYRTHFGGVRYLFVRGMQPDKPMSGVYQDSPELARVEALTELFNSN